MESARYLILLVFSIVVLGLIVHFVSINLKAKSDAQVYEGYIYEQPVLDGRFKKLEINDKRLYLSRYTPLSLGDYAQIDFSTCKYSEQYDTYSYCQTKVHQQEKHWLFGDVYKMRQGIINNIKKSLPSPHDSLVLAMTIGYEDDLPSSLIDNLREIGAIHMLVVSGYNVSLILNSTGVLLIRFGKTFYLVFSVSVLLLLLFVTGFDAPIVRAVIMGTFIVVSRILERVGNALYFLIVSAVLMVAWDFDNLSNLSFQLSFAATFGVLIFNELFKFKRQILNDLMSSVGATTFVLPIISYNFSTINFLGILSSLMLGWLVPYITYIGMLIFIFDNIAVRGLLTILIDIFMLISNFISRFSYINVEYKITARDLFMYYVFIGMILLFIYKVRTIKKND